MEDIEEWEDIPSCDKAKAEPDDAVSFEKAVGQIKARPTLRDVRVVFAVVVFACTEGERRAQYQQG